MSDKLERAIKKALVSTEYKPKPIPIRTESIENTIRKALFEQFRSKFVDPTVTGPMANLSATSGPKPDIFSKKAMGKAPDDPEDYSDVYGTYSPNLSTQYKGFDLNFDQLEAFAEAGKPKNFGELSNYFSDIFVEWENQESKSELINLGARPFLGTKAQGSGNLDSIFLTPDAIRDFVQRSEYDPDWYSQMKSVFPGKALEAYQLPMYGGGMSQVGTFIYFYEGVDAKSNIVYLNRVGFDTNKFFYWQYEPKVESKNSKGERVITGGVFWLGEKPGLKEAFIQQRNDGSNTVQPLDKTAGNTKIPTWLSNDPWITWFQNSHVYLASAFKSIDAAKGEQPMIWYSPSGTAVNLTALADKIHTAFDWIGILVPPIDIVNALWYAYQGRYVEAFISIIALIPGVGDAFALAFKQLWKGGKAIGKFFVEALFTTTQSTGRIFIETLSKFNGFAREFIKTAESIGILPPDFVRRFTNELDNILIEVNKALDDLIATRAQKRLQQQFNQKLGLEGADASLNLGKKVLQAFGAFAKSVKNVTGSTIWQFIYRVLSKPLRLIWTSVTKRAGSYWRAAYSSAYKKFAEGLMKNPDSVAMTLIGFVSKTTRAKFLKKLVDLYVNEFGLKLQMRRGKLMYDMGQGIYMSEKELINSIMKNPSWALRAIFARSRSAYNDFVVTVIREAAQASDNIINSFWQSYWTNPWRRFVSEYLTFGRLRSLGSVPGGQGWIKNTTDELVRSITEFWNNDIIKRLDIVYNELQEYFEQSDYGSVAGSEMSKNSVWYVLFDEAYWSWNKKHWIESQEEIEKFAQQRIPSMREMESSNQSNPTGMVTDSLTYQYWNQDEPGQANWKTAWMQLLVKRGTAKYIGEPKSYVLNKETFKLPGYPTWVILKDDSDNGVKKNTMFVINPQTGVMSNSDPESGMSFEHEFPGYVKFANTLARNPYFAAGLEKTANSLTMSTPIGIDGYKTKSGNWNYDKIIKSKNFIDIGNLIIQSRGGIFGNDLEAVAEAAFMAMAKPGMPAQIYQQVQTVVGMDPYKYVSNDYANWGGFMDTDKKYHKIPIDTSYKVIKQRMK